MNSEVAADQTTVRNLLKAAWAASALAVVPFVLLISFNQVSLLSWTSLGRLGVVSLLVLIFCLAFMFYRGRFWAGLPALAAFGGAIIYFGLSFLRVADKYLSVAPGRYFDLFMMCSPHLVIITISLTLGLVVWRGMRICRQLGPQPLSKRFWGIVILWALVLVGDFWFQAAGWRHFNYPSDLMVRLCQDDPQLAGEARRRLLEIGPAAVPELLFGMAAPDPDLSCLRQSSKQTILDLGRDATEPLLQAASEGNVHALKALAELGDKRALSSLREIKAGLKADSPPEFQKALEEAILKLEGEGAGSG